MRKRVPLPLLLILVAVAGGVAGCGGTSKTSTTSRTASEAEHAAEQTGAKREACEGERQADLTWVKAEERVLKVWDEPGETAALVQFDEDSYRVEAAGKKVVALMPQTREAVARFESAVGTMRSAAGEGSLARLTGAGDEAIAAWTAVYTACETPS